MIFHVLDSVQEKCECPDSKYPCPSTFSTYFRPTKRLVVTVIVDRVRLLYMTTDISSRLPNVSLVIILSCLFSVVYRFPVLYLYTFVRPDKLVVGLLAHDRRWIPVGFITAEFTIQLPLAGLITSAKFTMQWPLAG